VGDRASEALRRSTLFAVNEAYVPVDTPVADGDRVAFIPPVSGG
jgi:molybdopterin converting factor small subunit